MELQIFERNTTEISSLQLLCWDEELSDDQKAAYEAQAKSAERYKKIRENPLFRKKRTGSCEFLRKKIKPRIIQRTQVPTDNCHTYSLVVRSSASTVPFSQSMITGDVMTSAVTSVSSSLQSRPQMTAIQTPQLNSTVPPSLAQPMSAIHRQNSLQQQQQSLQNVQIRATSVLPMQSLQHLLYDKNSGIFYIPSSQAGQAPQQVAVRSSMVRQSTPVSSFVTRPTTSSAMIVSQKVNPNQMTNNFQVSQQQCNPTTKKVFITTPTSTPTSLLEFLSTPNSTTTSQHPRPATTVSSSPKTSVQSGPRPAMVRVQQLSLGQNTPVRSVLYRPPTTLTVVNGPVQQQQQTAIQSNEIGSKTPVSNKFGDAKGTPTVANGKSDTSSSSATENTKTFPSLVVNVKPCLHDKPSTLELTNARSELDQKVKQILMYDQKKFSEWLMQQGLVRLEHYCDIHKTKRNGPAKFFLGIFNDKDNGSLTGGFVWISDCCPGRQISIFKGSIFESPDPSPATVVKLMYHWACQTAASNVITWCKVSGSQLKNFYLLLRSVCIAALHEFCPKMGGPGKFIEVGIISLATTLTAPSGKTHIKIEIFGVFDPSSKMIRMKLVHPSSNTGSISEGSKNRGVQILSPISLWVDKSSTIIIDSSIDQNLLLDMGFKKIIQCKSTTQKETALSDSPQPTNINVMKYLGHVVPKMFQATLCVLSKNLIQQFLDELSWREKWGRTSKDSFDNILSHITTMNKWEFDGEKNLIAWLTKVSMNPFQDWSYTRQYKARSGIDLLPDSIRNADMPSLEQYERNPKVNSNEMALINLNRSGGPPLLLPQVPILTVNGPPKRKMEDSGGLNLTEYFIKHKKTTDLESYYYAELPGSMKQTTGKFPQHAKCPLCSKPFYSNLDVFRHIFAHVNAIGRSPSLHHFCNYCLKEFQPSAMDIHIQEHHKMAKIEGFACRICTEKFIHESQFVIHMWENHCAADTPYKCEICDYQASFHHQVIDHFNETHKLCDSVLCPLCLRVLSAKSSFCLKQITVHIQNHQMKKGKKCPQCVLVFFGDGEYRAHFMEGAHKELTNQSRYTIFYNSGDKGLLMATPPKIVRASVPPPPPPPFKKMKVSVDSPSKKNVGGMSRGSGVIPRGPQYNTHEHNLNFHGVKQKHCIECDVSITRPDHYPGHMSCIKCRFSTCCKTAMEAHHVSAHPRSGIGKSLSSIKVKEMPMMDKPLLCACQFQTVDPNRLARHLALCDKTTAFPLDWEKQKKKRAGLPPPEPRSILDHLGLMRSKAVES